MCACVCVVRVRVRVRRGLREHFVSAQRLVLVDGWSTLRVRSWNSCTRSIVCFARGGCFVFFSRVVCVFFVFFGAFVFAFLAFFLPWLCVGGPCARSWFGLRVRAIDGTAGTASLSQFIREERAGYLCFVVFFLFFFLFAVGLVRRSLEETQSKAADFHRRCAVAQIVFRGTSLAAPAGRGDCLASQPCAWRHFLAQKCHPTSAQHFSRRPS